MIQAHADPDPGFPMLTSFTRLETNTEDNVKEDLETWSQYCTKLCALLPRLMLSGLT